MAYRCAALRLRSQAFHLRGQEYGPSSLQFCPLLFVAHIHIILLGAGFQIHPLGTFPIVGQQYKAVLAFHIGQSVKPAGMRTLAQKVGPFVERHSAPTQSPIGWQTTKGAPIHKRVVRGRLRIILRAECRSPTKQVYPAFISSVGKIGFPTLHLILLRRKPPKVCCGLILKIAGRETHLTLRTYRKESLALGLKEAKDTVDGAPSLLKKGISKGKAERMKREIEAAGATIEIRQHIDSKLGYVLIKTSEYNNLLSERRRILEEGYAPYGYHIEKDKQEPDLWMKKVKNVLNTTAPEITIKKSEYDNLKKRANMSLWEKIKESWGR